MLPVHRVIGHKEYGNRAPGGWPGRKTDPVYDMNWRRARVANFTPRTAEEDPLSALTDDQQAELASTVGLTHYALMQLVKPSTDQIPGLLAAISTLAGLVADGHDDLTADELKGHISAEVDRAMGEFRERVAEGYDVRLEPKPDNG